MSDELELDSLQEDTGGLTRGTLLRRGAAVGLDAPTLSFLVDASVASAAGRALTPTFYQWIYNIHPDIPKAM